MSIILYSSLAALSILAALLLLPTPLRFQLAPLLRPLTVVALAATALSAALLGNSYLDYSRYYHLARSAHGLGTDYHAHQSRMVESERDIVLALAVIAMVAFLSRFAPLLADYAKLEKRFIAMEKQAKSASQAFLATTATSGNDSGKAADERAKLVKEITELRAEVTKLTKSNSALVSQTRNASANASAIEHLISADNPLLSATELHAQLTKAKAELERIQTDNHRLKTQLEDFELVMGDANKKRK